jgi:hypothetical protein
MHEMTDLGNPGRACALILSAAVGMALLAPVGEAGATGWKPNVRKGSDIVMKDHRWPVWDQGTYYCFWYMSFVPGHPRLGSFYGGIVVSGPRKAPGMFMSYWGEVRPVHEGEYFYPHGYGAEGASGGAHGDALFLRPGAWYRFVMRIFPPTRERDERSFVGWWVKDLEKNQWHTHSVVRLPARATGFAGNSGFVEALAPHHVHRAFERRLGYCRASGKWYKADTVTSGGPKFFKLIENGTVLRYDRSEPDSPSKSGTFTTKQPDTPQLDAPSTEGATARVYGNQVAVQWRIPKGAAPQLGYRLEVFGNTTATGNPIATAEDNAPHVLARRLDTPAEPKSVRVTVRDIFDQVTSVTIPVQAAACRPAANAAGLRPGLEYAYYEAPKDTVWERLPDFAALTPARQGYVATLDDTVQEDRYKLFALRYRGYLRVPADGVYVFSVGTCDGSRLSIDGEVIADDDGLHGASAKQYPVPLKEGPHAFELQYFKGPCRRHGGHANLADKISIRWEGPGFALRKLSEDDFLCERVDGPSLALSLKGAVAGGVLQDNLAEIRVRPDLRGHRLSKVQLHSGRMLLATARREDVEDSGDVVFRHLFPAGKNRIRARLWYDDRFSVDTDRVLDFETRELIEGPWKFIVLGHKYPIAARCKDGRASFMGEGFYVAYQKVSGDFTLTARIADIALTTRENAVHSANWIGLYTSNVSQQRKGEGIESTFNPWGFGIYLTAGQGMRGSSDHEDLAGSRMCIPSFPQDHRWLRIIRRGKRFQSFTSADGKTWRKAMEEICRSFTDEQYAGVCFRAVPGKGRALFQGALDNMTLARGEVPEEIRERPLPRDLPLGSRVTGVVQAPKDTGILYARTAGKGLPAPTSPLKAPGRVYWVPLGDRAPRFSKCCEVPDLGVTNIGFGAHENFATFATTRGVYYTWQRGNMFWQRRHDVPADRLFTALGYRQFLKEYAGRKNDWRTFSTTYAAPFSSEQQSPVYCCPDRTARKWSVLSGKARIGEGDNGPRLNEGVSCILPDREQPKTLYLCNRHGIFKTVDRGESYRLVCASESPE